MVEFKAEIISVRYHKPEYHVNVKIYIDSIYNSDAVITVLDGINIDDAKELVKDKLKEIKASLTLGSQLNGYVRKEIVL